MVANEVQRADRSGVVVMYEDYPDSDLFDIWDGGLEMKSYVADFETTTDPEDCRVWAWGVVPVESPDLDNFEYGNTIEGFLEWCRENSNCRVYFHNLGFDGAFLLDYLESEGWEWREDDKKPGQKFYTTLIGDSNQFYSITTYFNRYKRVQFYDSLKVIPMSVAAMAKSYGLDMLKGELDYDEYREYGHVLTDEELDYLSHDVIIVAKVLSQFLDAGLSKMTIGSNALFDYKKTVGNNKGFRDLYPELDKEQDAFIRKAYRGGFTYADKRTVGKKVGAGLVFDVNSLYPSVMYYEELPCGLPEWFDGKPIENPFRPLWVANVSCLFRIKKDHIPCIQLKGHLKYSGTEYIEDSDGIANMTVTNVDWELINQQYDVEVIEWHGGYTFNSLCGSFTKYIDKWMGEKVKATKEGNKGKRQIAKLMLNSLYGKFATRITAIARKPYRAEDGSINYEDLPEDERKPVYLPVGVFITSYARYKTVTSAQSVYDRFLYADTDSLHILGTEVPDCLDVDDTELGCWKLESTFEEAKFLRAKCYVEKIDENLTVHVAGMPAYIHPQVRIDSFALGQVYEGKLYQCRVPGGIVLVPGEMELRK